MIVVVMGVAAAARSTVGAALARRARLAVPRRRRFPSAGERREDGRRHAADRRRPLAVARSPRRRDAARSSRAAERGARVLGAAAGLSRRGSRAPATCASSICAATTTTIAQRLAARQHRYMPATLLASQFATLEEPRDAIDVDVARPSTRRLPPSCSACARDDRPRTRSLAASPSRDDAQRPSTMTKRPRYRRRPRCHLGRDPRRYLGAVNTPVFRASTMLFPTVADLERAARGEYPRHGVRTARPADRHRPAATRSRRSKAGTPRSPFRRA